MATGCGQNAVLADNWLFGYKQRLGKSTLCMDTKVNVLIEDKYLKPNIMDL